MRKKEKDGFVNAFLCYDWIVSYTNPIIERLYISNLSVPPLIKEHVAKLAETEATKETLENPNCKPNYFLSSPSINMLLLRLIYEDIPLYKVGDREISCMADIGRLWKEAGLSADILGWKEHYQVKAFLAKQHRKILKELETTKLGTQATPASTPQNSNDGVFLDTAGRLLVGGEKVKLSPACAELLRFMITELKGHIFLELQHILTSHYGIESRNRLCIAKEARQPFDKEKSKINSLCKKPIKKDLIKSLGDKKYSLSLNIRLPKNSPKDSP